MSVPLLRRGILNVYTTGVDSFKAAVALSRISMVPLAPSIMILSPVFRLRLACFVLTMQGIPSSVSYTHLTLPTKA